MGRDIEILLASGAAGRDGRCDTSHLELPFTFHIHAPLWWRPPSCRARRRVAATELREEANFTGEMAIPMTQLRGSACLVACSILEHKRFVILEVEEAQRQQSSRV